MYRKFDLTAVRTLDFDELVWPARKEVAHGAFPGGNSEYADLRGLNWQDARRVFELESSLIGRIEAATDVDAESEAIEDSLYQSPDNLYGLDLGVASTVVCLAAAGCVPFSSCNGGVFGGHHQEAYPLVAFFTKVKAAKQILVAAEQAEIGIENGPGGCAVASASDIRAFRAFAAAVLKRRRL